MVRAKFQNISAIYIENPLNDLPKSRNQLIHEEKGETIR